MSSQYQRASTIERYFLQFFFIILTAILSSSCSRIMQSIPSPVSEFTPITVYFTDKNLYAAGIPPFEVGVTRMVPSASNSTHVVLKAFFDGPTPEEQDQGLELITSGFNGFSELIIVERIARVYLTGMCTSSGATYTIAQPLMRNLLQFEEIAFVKIYDENGDTEEPEGASNSIPFCLEP